MVQIMVDNLSRLEERVEGLLNQIAGGAKTAAELSKENERLREELELYAELEKENAALTEEVERLRTELHSTNEREGMIRDRLEGMLEKIDSIESEIEASRETE